MDKILALHQPVQLSSSAVSPLQVFFGGNWMILIFAWTFVTLSLIALLLQLAPLFGAPWANIPWVANSPMNLASPSPKEKMTMGPLNLLALLAAFRVAIL
jgi:hypothetical protein